jgi:hypothetical protein
MTTSDRKKAHVLVGLLAIAGITWFLDFGARGNQGTETKKGPRRPAIERQIKDPTIQIKLIENLGLDGGGEKNIFQYRREPLPPAVATIRTKSVPTEGNTTLVLTVTLGDCLLGQIEDLELKQRQTLPRTFQ